MSKKTDKAKRKSEAHKRIAAEKAAREAGVEVEEIVTVKTTKKVVKADKPAKAKKTPKQSKHAGAPPKPSIFERLKTYFVGVVAELKRVVWPTRQEVLNSTVVVLVALVFFAIFAFIVDWLSTGIMDFLIGLAAG